MEQPCCNSSKFETWTAYTLIGNAITLPGVGTNPHTVKLTFQTNSITAYFDGVLMTSATTMAPLTDSLPTPTELSAWTCTRTRTHTQ